MKIIKRYAILYLRIGNRKFDPADLVDIFGVTGNNAKVILTRMLKRGMVKRAERGRYALQEPLEFIIGDSFGRDITGFMDLVYEKYYFTGPSALSYYGLASSREYYLTVEDDKAVKIFSRSSGIEVKTLKRGVNKGNYKRVMFEGGKANLAEPDVAIAETLLMDPEIIQFYAIPAVCEYAERGYDRDSLLKASKDAGVQDYLKKILRVLADNGFNITKVPKVRVTGKERDFILGGINV